MTSDAARDGGLGRLTLRLVLHGGLVFLAGWPGVATAADSLWTYVAAGDVRFVNATLNGVVLVVSDSALGGAASESGEALWSRGDLGGTRPGQLTVVPSASLVLVQTAALGDHPARVEAIEILTGRTEWNSDSLGAMWARGEWLLPERGLLLLLCAEDPMSPESWRTVALDLATGSRRWTAEGWFKFRPLIVTPATHREEWPEGPEPMRPALLDSDTTMIVYVSSDGPMRVDTRTGRPLWRANVPGFSSWHSPGRTELAQPMVESAETLYVANGGRLVALSIQDGRPVWKRHATVRSAPTRMEMTSRGLLASGTDFLTLLDARTGGKLWRRPITFWADPAAPVAVRGDSIYFAAEGLLTWADLETGAWRDLAPLRFKGGEHPFGLVLEDQSVRVRASQNLASFDLAGHPQYRIFHPGPEIFPGAVAGLLNFAIVTATVTLDFLSVASGGLPVAPSMIGNRVARAQQRSASCSYILCDFEDDRGNGLVRIDNETGEELGRFALGKRVPIYTLDPLEDRIYVVGRGGRVIAHRF